jgi:hypothetical protein
MRIWFQACLFLLICSATVLAQFPTGYDQMYLLLSWPHDARAMALGDGIVAAPDGYHNDALLNPSFASFTKGLYVSANTYTRLVNGQNLSFISSKVSSTISGDGNLDKAQFQRLQIGTQLPLKTAMQFSFVRNYVREIDRSYTGNVLDWEIIEDTRSELYGLTISVRPTAWFAIGATGKYFVSHYRFEDDNSGWWSHSGTSFDVGACALNLFPGLTWEPRISQTLHGYAKFRGQVHRGMSASVSLRDFGPKCNYGQSFGHYNELPTTLKGTISFVPVCSDELSVELFGGFAQNYRGSYRERFWDLSYADRAGAIEVTLVNLIRIRFSDFQFDMDWSNAWGISLGPPGLQLEFAQRCDLGILTDHFTSYNEGRSVLSLTANLPLR